MIRVQGLTKTFRRYDSPGDRLFEWLTFGRRSRHTTLVALHPLDFSIGPGESLGIIGENGAGKSTLLKLISGVLYPNAGSVKISGRVVSLLELGAGFNPELDGISNIFESARLLGYERSEIETRLDAILEFAELGDFVHQPVRTLSSGMFVRLAFSLFAHLDPDVYIVDEALAVGDVFFQQKCFAFLESLKDRGVAVILASHDMHAILRLCDRVLYLEHGRVIDLGDPVVAVNRYHSSHDASGQSKPQEKHTQVHVEPGEFSIPTDAREGIDAHEPRHGAREVEVLGVRFVDREGMPSAQIESSQQVTLEIYAKVNQDVDDLTFGFQIIDRHNTVIFGQTIYQKDRSSMQGRAGESFRVDYDLDCTLTEGQYVFEVHATDCRVDIANRIYDQLPRVRTLTVTPASRRTYHGMAGIRSKLRIEQFGG